MLWNAVCRHLSIILTIVVQVFIDCVLFGGLLLFLYIKDHRFLYIHFLVRRTQKQRVVLIVVGLANVTLMDDLAEVDFTRVERGAGCLGKREDFVLLWVRLDRQIRFTGQGNPRVL